MRFEKLKNTFAPSNAEILSISFFPHKMNVNVFSQHLAVYLYLRFLCHSIRIIHSNSLAILSVCPSRFSLSFSNTSSLSYSFSLLLHSFLVSLSLQTVFLCLSHIFSLSLSLTNSLCIQPMTNDECKFSCFIF